MFVTLCDRWLTVSACVAGLNTKHDICSRVQCVSFNHRVTVYPADDYDRTGPWMHAAVDRMRFRSRIEQTQLILAPVLNEKYLRYRDRAINEHCREWIFNKRQLQSAVSLFCGHYCVCFCILRSRDISLPSFFDLLYPRYWTYRCFGTWGVV